MEAIPQLSVLVLSIAEARMVAAPLPSSCTVTLLVYTSGFSVSFTVTVTLVELLFPEISSTVYVNSFFLPISVQVNVVTLNF